MLVLLKLKNFTKLPITVPIPTCVHFNRGLLSGGLFSLFLNLVNFGPQTAEATLFLPHPLQIWHFFHCHRVHTQVTECEAAKLRHIILPDLKMYVHNSEVLCPCPKTWGPKNCLVSGGFTTYKGKYLRNERC